MLSIVRDPNFVEHIWYSVQEGKAPLPVCWYGIVSIIVLGVAFIYISYSHFKK